VGVEGGAIALGCLLLALASWALRWRKRRHDMYAGSVAALVVALVSAQTSGDLYDSRCIFLLMVMASPVVESGKTIVRTCPLPRPIQRQRQRLAA
jgi:NhaP-type Na+/H+ or K+/H+ antiporter